MLLAIAGIAASGVCTAVVWHVVRDDGPYQAIKGMVAVDGFSVFVRTVVLVATLLCVFLSAGYLRERLEGPEYLALLLLSATGMMIMATRERSRRRVPRARDPVDRALRPGRVRPPPVGVAGGRAQVLRARRVLVRDLPVRHRAHLRRDRHHLAHRHRDVPRQSRSRPPRRARRGLRVPARRARVQGRRGAVPHVDARRVPGCSDAGHRVHGVGDEGGRVRRVPAHLRGHVPAVRGRLAAGGLGPRRSLARRRNRRRDRADQREADARVLVDQSRGLRADRRAGRDDDGIRPRSSTCSSTRSWRSARSG